MSCCSAASNTDGAAVKYGTPRRARSTRSDGLRRLAASTFVPLPATSSCIRPISAAPSLPASFSRPRYGAMYRAPIVADASACAGEYTAVISTLAPRSTRADAAANPIRVAGTFTTARSPRARISSAWASISAVVAPQVWKKISFAPSDSHRAYKLGDVVHGTAAALEDGRVGRDAVDQAGGEQLRDRLDIGTVGVETWFGRHERHFRLRRSRRGKRTKLRARKTTQLAHLSANVMTSRGDSTKRSP